eukprot:TRINITY_DN96_c0_g1_i5.p2 TRINITY_DN96_c0_g1~~TRINITY_DN96_c0_g1_i5.p2  ORF type:complete len:110 (+),score=22.67 TRINITY_DN96_c0_g1_i5:260-589(+)
MLSFHGLELVHLLQLGDLEGSVGLAGLHLQIGNFHVPLLHLVFFVKLLTEDNTRFVIQGLAEGSKVVFAHGRDIGRDPTFSRTASGTPILESTGELPMYSALIPLLTLR